jgi:protein arginine N-methyltransferase 1
MITDKGRMDAYTQALRQVVKPGSVVLDIGTGTGIFALMACQFGARRVYAIEPADVIQVARSIAVSNGYADRVEFIQDLSTRITLPEKADVIISDLRGVLPLFHHHIPSVVDARRRLLASKGVLISQRDTLWVAVAEVPELYKNYTIPWADHYFGFDMKAALPFVKNSWQKFRVKPEQLLVDPKCWATLDYLKVESPDVKGEVNWTVTRAGTAHGLIVWFDATLIDGISFSNAPHAPELIYGSFFYPWSTSVNLAVGDTVNVYLEANLVGDDYLWRWNTRVLDQGQPDQVKADFRQSSFFSVPLSPLKLRKKASNYVPKLNEDGKIDRTILDLLNSDVSLGEIASRLLTQFPSRFPKWENALAHVGELSEKYSQ